MICPNCHIDSKNPNICTMCETVIIPLVEKVKKVKPRGKIRNASKNLVKKQKEYSKLRKEFLEGKMCVVFPLQIATTVHHSKGRGKYLLDVSTWVPCSMDGHTQIENHPEWSRDKGFTVSRLTD